MKRKSIGKILALLLFSMVATALHAQPLQMNKIGGYSTGIYDAGGCEIVTYDATSQRLFSVNASTGDVDIISLANPASPSLITSVDLSVFGSSANSVSCKNGVVAIAVEDFVKQNNGKVVFMNTSGTILNSVTVGALPDMLTFTPDGSKVLVANEGEPNAAYTIDPIGSVSIIDVSGGIAGLVQGNVTTLDFTAFNSPFVLDPSIRVFGPGATVAMDFEPEYITVSENSQTAWITLQENNAVAILDIPSATFTSIKGLGFKDHSIAGNGLDASDQSGVINIATWPIKGMYLPDGIASYVSGGNQYIVTANEGDTRAYSGFNEEARISTRTLDPVAFPTGATLKLNTNLGRLGTSTVMGNTDADPELEELYSIGTRSITIRDAAGNLVWDSGDKMEQVTALTNPTNFNASNTNNTFKNRSDDKGPEPEGVAIGQIGDSTYAFVGLERIGGVMVFNITNPATSYYVTYINSRNFTQAPGVNLGGDLGVEGIIFIPAAQSPNGKNLVVTGNEISGTIAVFEITLFPEINVLGNATSIVDGDASASLADHTDFGKTNIGSTFSRTFTISNTGLGALTVSAITLGGDASFSLVGLPTFPLTIVSGGSQTIQVQFAPTTSAVANATLTIANNDDDESTFDFAIKGTGLVAPVTGPSSSQSPYVLPSQPGVKTTAILTVGDAAANGYVMCGIPDGTGAYDNGNGTFTLLVSHEFGGTAGVVRAHGSTGAFVSKWIINKSNFSVISGSDLITTVKLWNGSGFTTGTTQFNRFCSADLPEVSAFYNSVSGKGTQERIYMNGEESGAEGRAFGNIVTGPNAGTTYQLPYLGRFSWENAVAAPYSSDKTIVVGTDDATPGQVYVYIGTKTNTGNEIEKAGLNNGKLFGIAVTGLSSEVSATNLVSAPFTMADLGFVQNTTGAALQTASVAAGVTQFLRPEDAHWDPSNPNVMYFVTTNNFSSPSKLWKVVFTDINNPELGGTITSVLDGSEGQKMLDNMTVDNYGHVLLQEDPGNQSHIAKIHQYTIATDAFVTIAEHDANRFISGAPNFLTQDEEASGIIDATFLGTGNFLMVDQAHYPQPGQLVEGGQILALFNPSTLAACPPSTWYADTDNDSFGNKNDSLLACDAPVGYVSNKNDCDDSNASITDKYTLQLLHASDFEASSSAVADAPRFAALVDAFDTAYPNTLILSSGDNILPSPFSFSGEDPALVTPLKNAYISYYGSNFANNDLRAGIARPDISIMNFIGVEASVLGNHEFDLGTPELRNIIAGVNSGAAIRWFGAQFPYLSSNLNFTGDVNLSNIFTPTRQQPAFFKSNPSMTAAAIAATPKLAPSCYIIKGGQKIGVVGVTTPILAAISSPGTTTIKNPGAGTENMALLATIVQPYIDSLRNQEGIEKIILLAHLQQLSNEKALAVLLNGVDIIVAGGSHTLMADATDRLRAGDVAVETYPFLTTGADGFPVAIVNTAAEYAYLGRLVVDFDCDNHIIPASINPAISGAYAADSIGVVDAWGTYAAAFTPGSKASLVKSLCDAVGAVISLKDGDIVGKTSVYLEGRRNFVRTEETNLGNLSADANLWLGKFYDNSVTISIKNGGGIRSSIGYIDAVGNQVTLSPPAANPSAGKLQGDISRLDIENSLRFNNLLSTLTLTATNLRTILEHGVAASGPGQTQGRFPQISGVRFSYNETLPAGSRILNAVITDAAGNTIDSLIVNGAVYGNPSRTFRVITLNFLAGGGDGYPFNTLGTGRVDLNTLPVSGPNNATFAIPGSEQDAFAEYTKNFHSVTPYNKVETPASADIRIQEVNDRVDCIYPTTSSTTITACDSYLWNNTTYTTSGTYTYTTLNSVGCDSIATLILTINSTSSFVADAGQDFTACSLSTISLNGSISGGATTGTWSTLGTGSFTPNANALNAVYNPSAADILAGSVQLVLRTDSIAPCAAKRDTVVITLQSVLAGPSVINGQSSICNPLPNLPFIYSVPAVVGATNYLWTVPNGTTIVSGQGTTTLVVSWSSTAIQNGVAGNITVSSNNTNLCGSSTPKSLFISVQATSPVTPGSVSSQLKICPNDPIQTMSVAPVARATYYSWTLPAGMTIVSGNGTNIITASVNSSFVGGNVTVAAGNGCGVSPVRSRTLFLNNLPAPASISGFTTGVCEMNGVSYSIPPVTGALSYQWTLPANVVATTPLTGTTISVNFLPGFVAGNVSVSAVNNCGVGTARTLTVSGAPGTPSSISGSLNPCFNTTNSYSISTVQGATSYNWLVSNASQLQILPSSGPGIGQGNKNIEIKTNAILSNGIIAVNASNACGIGRNQNLTPIVVSVCPRIGSLTSDVALVAFPNPASDIVNIAFVSEIEQFYTLNLIDATGRVVLTENNKANEGENQVRVNVNGFASGIYTLQCQMNGHAENVRIFIK